MILLTPALAASALLPAAVAPQKFKVAKPGDLAKQIGRMRTLRISNEMRLKMARDAFKVLKNAPPVEKVDKPVTLTFDGSNTEYEMTGYGTVWSNGGGGYLLLYPHQPRPYFMLSFKAKKGLYVATGVGFFTAAQAKWELRMGSDTIGSGITGQTGSSLGEYLSLPLQVPKDGTVDLIVRVHGGDDDGGVGNALCFQRLEIAKVN